MRRMTDDERHMRFLLDQANAEIVTLRTELERVRQIAREAIHPTELIDGLSIQKKWYETLCKIAEV